MHVATPRKSLLFGSVVQDKTLLTPQSALLVEIGGKWGKPLITPLLTYQGLKWLSSPQCSSHWGKQRKDCRKRKKFHCLFAVADAWAISLCLRWGMCTRTCTFESCKTRQGLLSFKGCSQAKFLYNSIILWCHDSYLSSLTFVLFLQIVPHDVPQRTECDCKS